MSYTHLLSLSKEKCELFLSNVQVEDELRDEDPSSAAFFTTSVSVDLEPLLFLRSSSARLSLSYLTIDALALAYTRMEHISVTLSAPLKKLTSNFIFNKKKIPPINEKVFNLEFTDFTAPTPEDPLIYINDLFSHHMNPFIAYRLSLNFFDKDLFKEDLFSKASLNDPIEFTPNDINILLQYIDIMAFTRQVYAVFLAAGNEQMRPSFKLSNIETSLTEKIEKERLTGSRTLKTAAERISQDSKDLFHLVKFEWFYAVPLNKSSQNRLKLTAKLNTNFTSIFTNGPLGIDPSSPALSSTDRTLISDLQISNLAMLAQGESIRRILLVQLTKINAAQSPSSLFSAEFLSLSIDESSTKAKFSINNQFLPPDETEITILFPKQASYCLGCSASQTYIKIGPISNHTNTISNQLPRLSNIITSRTQRLPCAIRNHPKLIRLSTNILSASENKDLWPKNEDFPEFHTIFCAAIDETTIQQRFIHKSSSDLEYHRMLRSENSLHQIALLVQDQNSRIIFFPRNTYVFVTIRLQPLSNE